MIVTPKEENTVTSINAFLRNIATKEDKANFCERHNITRGELDALLGGEGLEIGGEGVPSVVELPTFVSDTDEINNMLKERDDDGVYMVYYRRSNDVIGFDKLTFVGDEEEAIPFVVNEIERKGLREVLSEETISKLVEREL